MLNSSEELQVQMTDSAKELKLPTMAECFAQIWGRRRWLTEVTGAGLVLTIAITLVIPNKYTSTAQLMPPDAQLFTSSSNLGLLSGGGLSMPGVGSSLLNQRTPSATSMGVLVSRTVLDDIVNRFDLRRVYHVKLYLEAREELLKNTSILEDKKSGIISISVTDRDRYRARDIAQAYVEELDNLVNSLSTSSARRERAFLEQRLKSIKSDLDESSRALSDFSSRNATMDPNKQGQATVEQAGRLQGELIAAQTELSGLKAQYTDDNVRVREVRGRIDELQSQLRKISGIGENENGADLTAGQLFPSVRKLPLLGFTYYDLERKVTMQETLYEALSKQYELAKVEEAKQIPPIKVLDSPDIPEKKSSPHRTALGILGALGFAIGGCIWVVLAELKGAAKRVYPERSFAMSLASLFKEED
jgi:capsule polysaccharide export protein KpsE/RkpR